jgi:hypothetical protein
VVTGALGLDPQAWRPELQDKARLRRVRNYSVFLWVAGVSYKNFAKKAERLRTSGQDVSSMHSKGRKEGG